MGAVGAYLCAIIYAGGIPIWREPIKRADLNRTVWLQRAESSGNLSFMERKIQLRLILDVVEREGEISRSQSLAMFIPRLPSRIAELKGLGFRFQAGRRGDDYVYKLVARPDDMRRSALM